MSDNINNNAVAMYRIPMYGPNLIHCTTDLGSVTPPNINNISDISVPDSNPYNNRITINTVTVDSSSNGIPQLGYGNISSVTPFMKMGAITNDRNTLSRYDDLAWDNIKFIPTPSWRDNKISYTNGMYDYSNSYLCNLLKKDDKIFDGNLPRIDVALLCNGTDYCYFNNSSSTESDRTCKWITNECSTHRFIDNRLIGYTSLSTSTGTEGDKLEPTNGELPIKACDVLKLANSFSSGSTGLGIWAQSATMDSRFKLL